MSALNTDLVRLTTPNFATTLANSMLISDTTMTLQTATGLTTTTAITLVIDATDPVSGSITSNLKEVVTGTLSGSVVSNLVRGLDGTTQQAHASGANVVMWWNANMINDFMNSYLAQHKQLGTHTGITTDTINATGNAVVGGTLGVTGAASFVNAVLAGTLTGAGLGNQVQTQANAGTAGGNLYWINLAGIKLMWGLGAAVTSNTAGASYTFTLPAFFTAIQSQLSAASNVTIDGRQYCAIDNSSTTSSILVICTSGTNGSTQKPAIFVAGT